LFPVYIFTQEFQVMKYLVLLLCVFAFCLSNAQTKIIAHKSHSGSRQSFKADGLDNFGIDMRMYRKRSRTVSITKIADTLFVFKNHITIPFYSNIQDSFELDTVYSHQLLENPAIDRDSLQKLFQQAELIGFKKNKEPIFDSLPAEKKEHLPIVPALPNNSGGGWFVLLAGLIAVVVTYGGWKHHRTSLSA